MYMINSLSTLVDDSQWCICSQEQGGAKYVKTNVDSKIIIQNKKNGKTR